MSSQLFARLKKIEQFKAKYRLAVHFFDVTTYDQIKEKLAVLKKGGVLTVAINGKLRRIHENDVVIIDDVME